MKTILAIVAMVLLSGAAWGETVDQCFDRWKQYTSGVTNNVSADYILDWCRKTPKQRFSGPDPTAWKQTDSRYRLEKNEITGKCRVTEFRDNRWQNASAFDIFDGCSCENASKRLEEYRQSEHENKAWRPIR